VLKDLFDRAASLGLLIIFSPVFLIVSIFILVSLGRPVFFKQYRPGISGTPFLLLKFRTMKDLADASGKSLPDKDRMTKSTRFLRRCSLDELPEIFNVLKGDMSLVGPRPLLMKYLTRYSEEQWRRHEVKPGITGWAQVNGRNAIGWEERFKLDVWYIDNISFRLDLRILLLTAWKVIKREGINQPGHATAEEFMGNLESDN
jgi:lipopolysaccharide/colanic/teichoic acid biosynthesis glycosyltransferase